MSLSWFGIFRLGLVQLCLGAIVVLMTSTLNRLMIVELALPAVLPGLLVALHYGIQITRPNWGFPVRHRRAPHALDHRRHGGAWLGAYLAALSIPVLEHRFLAGLALAMVAYALIGLGVGASGTSLLALLATTTAAAPPACSGDDHLADDDLRHRDDRDRRGPIPRPLQPRPDAGDRGHRHRRRAGADLSRRLGHRARPDRASAARPDAVREGIAEIWHEPAARRFTVFVFLSMTAYFMQELILEPFAGLVFAFTPGQTTSMSGAQNGGVFLGHACGGNPRHRIQARLAARLGGWRLPWLGGALATIAAIGIAGPATALVPAVMALGFFNGMFAVAAIGSMMALAGQGRQGREGTRMGLWGAAQAIAAGFGGLAGAALVDVMRRSLASDASAFGTVFLIEAALFLAAAAMAMRVMERRDTAARAAMIAGE
jgi:MFS transporter, BCD family, chlorophyll transporter